MRRSAGGPVVCWRVAGIVAVWLASAFSAPSLAAPTQGTPGFSCGATVERDVWQLWDSRASAYVRDQVLSARLLKKGDSYALYDLQTHLQNLVSMARRCGRTDRLLELADDLMVVYSTLEPLGDIGSGKAWVCKGGRVCNEKNGLVNREVPLVSAQGLGLLSSLADALANSSEPRAKAHPFVARTAEVSASHLLRWSGNDTLQKWQRLRGVRPLDVKDGSAELLFTDLHLWQIAIYASLAGIYSAEPALYQAVKSQKGQLSQLANAARTLLELFRSRVTLDTVTVSGVGRVRTADLDRGYWRLYRDSRYAGYSGLEKPATCVTQPDGSTHVQVLVPASEVPLVQDIGWDISHARRLVPTLEWLRVNRKAMTEVYGLTAAELPDPDLRDAFAAQLVGRIWNGDKAAPLFSNYWSGTNGWYRVAYDNGTGACYSGYPPFGLSDSFPTGGYVVWTQSYAVIGELGRRIYDVTHGEEAGKQDYAKRYFPDLVLPAGSNNRMLTELMFWPSLVQ